MELTQIEDIQQAILMLKSLKAKNAKLFIWQHLENQERYGFEINAEDLAITKRFLLFGDQRQALFKTGEDLFFYYEKLMLIFKCKVLKKGPGHLFLGQPEKIQLKSTRKEPRMDVISKRLMANISKKVINTSGARFKFSLFDISEGGISFLADPYYELTFVKGEEVKIHSINQHIMTPVIGSTIVYVENFRWNGQDLVKMGLQFKRKLSISEIKAITS